MFKLLHLNSEFTLFVAFICIIFVCCKVPSFSCVCSAINVYCQPKSHCWKPFHRAYLSTISRGVTAHYRLRPNRLIRRTLLNKSCVRYTLMVVSQRDLRSYRASGFDFEIWFSIKRENSEQSFADTRTLIILETTERPMRKNWNRHNFDFLYCKHGKVYYRGFVHPG